MATRCDVKSILRSSKLRRSGLLGFLRRADSVECHAVNGSSRCGLRHQKLPERRQHRLKQPPRPARAWVIATQLLDEFFFSMDEAEPAFHLRFGRVALTALAGDLKRSPDRCTVFSWHISSSLAPSQGEPIVNESANQRLNMTPNAIAHFLRSARCSAMGVDVIPFC